MDALLYPKWKQQLFEASDENDDLKPHEGKTTLFTTVFEQEKALFDSENQQD